MPDPIPLGAQVRDTVTGFEGTLTARTEYLGRTPAVLIEAPWKDTFREVWLAEGRVELAPVQPRPSFVKGGPDAGYM